MNPAEALYAAAREYARAEKHLEHHTLTEGDIIARNRAERELREAAVAYAATLRTV